MSDEEWSALATLLQEAYPAPEKGTITKNVMTQICREKVSRKRQVQQWFRRYGGMAACVVLLCGVLFMVYPQLNRAMDGMVEDEAVLTEAAEQTLAETEAVEEVAMYSDQAAGFAMPRATVTEEPEKEEAVEEETSGVQTYSATSLLKSVAMYATVESDTSVDAADDSSLADGFLSYLLSKGYFTSDEYQSWLTERGTDTVWEPEELCEAFGLDTSVYDTWLRK